MKSYEELRAASGRLLDDTGNGTGWPQITDIRLLAQAVPELLDEIERLKKVVPGPPVTHEDDGDDEQAFCPHCKEMVGTWEHDRTVAEHGMQWDGEPQFTDISSDVRCSKCDRVIHSEGRTKNSHGMTICSW